jgi:hypothetical protein
MIAVKKYSWTQGLGWARLVGQNAYPEGALATIRLPAWRDAVIIDTLIDIHS